MSVIGAMLGDRYLAENAEVACCKKCAEAKSSDSLCKRDHAVETRKNVIFCSENTKEHGSVACKSSRLSCLPMSHINTKLSQTAICDTQMITFLVVVARCACSHKASFKRRYFFQIQPLLLSNVHKHAAGRRKHILSSGYSKEEQAWPVCHL